MTDQHTVVSPYLTALNAVKEAKDQGLNLDITCHGRAGFGNEFFRVRYGQDNLVAKVVSRFDLNKLGPQSDAINEYIGAVEGEKQFPWTVLPEDFEFFTIPMIVKINPETHLPESLEASDAMLKALQTFPRKKAYLRQWKASSKGTGVELVLILEEDGVLNVLELSINYYQLTQHQLMLKQLQAMVNKPKEAVTS